MNCNELHAHFENDPQLNAGISAEMAGHAATCVECTRFMEEQAALQKSLRLVRESVAPVPESLDARVLASFRSQSSAPKPVISFPRRTPILRRTAAIAAIAAALLVAAMVYITARKPAVSTSQAAQPQVPVQTKTAPAIAPTPVPVHAQAAPVPKHSRRGIARPALASNQHSDPVPDRFRSLMYCDELACAAPMDVIRVQLPSDFVARPARGLVSTGTAVTADVLIGPDGIARGIRIVE